VTYRHEIRVRYGEVDMQRVVFNAHYLAYCDDAVDTWIRSVPGGYGDASWDMMLKKIEVTWHGSAGLQDVLALDVDVRRWGNTSFDVGVEGGVDGRPVFSAVITYVAVVHGTTDTVPVPEGFRAAVDAADA
jgi:acyl-CoA thioester hydrolase